MTTAKPKRKATTYFGEQQRILEQLQEELQEEEELERAEEDVRLMTERLEELERHIRVLTEQLRRGQQAPRNSQDNDNQAS